MEWLRFSQGSITNLTLLIPSLVITVYLLQIKEKSRPTWLLALFFTSWTLLFAISFFSSATKGFLKAYLSIFNLFFVLTALIAWLQFAYQFPENTWPRESRRVWILSLLFSLFSLALVAWDYYLTTQTYRQDFRTFAYLLIILVIFFELVWVIVVHLRQTVHFSTAVNPSYWQTLPRSSQIWQNIRHPQGKSAQAARAFVLVVLAPLVVILFGFLRNVGLITPETQNSISNLGTLLFLIAFSIVYLNYSPDSSTFMFKLLLSALVMVLWSLSIMASITLNSYDVAYASLAALPINRTLHYTPNLQGGYNVTPIVIPSFDDELGQRVPLTDEATAPLSLPFLFPFYDQVWDKVYISSNGTLFFSTTEPNQLLTDFIWDVPQIAVLSLDLDPELEGGVFEKVAQDTVTISWYKVPQAGTSLTNTFQVVLHRDGSFETNYKEIQSLQVNFIGIRPHTANGLGRSIHFGKDLPFSGGAQQAIYEEFYPLYIHQKTSPLLYIIVFAAILVLLIFPFFFRVSLVRPLATLLDGVTKANAGNRNLQVPVQYRDEIGFLAQSFNQLVSTIRTAEDDLRQANAELENRVQARTADLLEANTQLRYEITERERAEQALQEANDTLELRVEERTMELSRSNTQLVQEIEERQRIEVKQTRLLKELAQANEDLTRFSYISSHDLRAPLRAIASLAEWLTMDYADKLDDEGKDLFKLMMGRIERMETLIESVLQYSQAGQIKGDPSEVDCQQLVQEIIQSLPCPENIQITIQEPLPTLLGYPSKLKQVWRHLIHNAIKFMGKPNGDVVIGCVDAGDYWQFSVSDNGIGIEERFFDRIFEAFQTLAPRDEVEGAGIGLAIVKKIVETQLGSVWVVSEMDKGSTFYFTLPKSPILPAQE